MRFLMSLALILSANLAAADTNAVFDPGARWLHYDTWVDRGESDVAQDLAQAGREGKSLMILWEQQGCLYCDRLRQTNFNNPVIRDILEDNFLVVSLNMAGNRRVRGFDGTVMTEVQLARQMKVTGTPTTVVYNSGGVLKDVSRSAVAFRMPGYLTSFHYFTVLAYFLSDRHEEMSLRQFTNATAEEFRARGINPGSW
jgi:thioredoxin-related protein